MDDCDKLKLIEKEIQEAINYCVSSGLNTEQLRQCAEPLIQISKEKGPITCSNHKRNRTVRLVVIISVVIAVVGILLQWSASYRWICVFAKCFAVKLLPYWDWTVFYEKECMLSNPYKVEDILTEDDCEICEDHASIEHEHNISHTSMTDEYLFENIPVIITDASHDWKATQEFNIELIKQLYKQDEVLSKHDLCNYNTASGHRFVQIRDDDVRHFHVYWENCHIDSMKAFRTYYTRPYFLPPMVEMGTTNILAMATPVEDTRFGEDHHKFLGYNTTDSVTWFSQVSGQYLIRLNPRSPCDKICRTLQFVLKEGHTLVLPNDMWLFLFVPHGDSPSIAIGCTGNWD